MHPSFRVILAGSLFLWVGPLASGSAQEAPACKSPIPVQSTRTMIRYRAISERMGERGATRLLIILGADGAPLDVSIAKSSGSQRLDNAAAAHIEMNYRWEAMPAGCSPAKRTVEIAVNWWLDPLPNPSAIKADEAGIEVIDVRGQCIHLWAYDGPNGGSSGSAPCRAP
jgi:TonB family protein